MAGAAPLPIYPYTPIALLLIPPITIMPFITGPIVLFPHTFTHSPHPHLTSLLPLLPGLPLPHLDPHYTHSHYELPEGRPAPDAAPGYPSSRYCGLMTCLRRHDLPCHATAHLTTPPPVQTVSLPWCGHGCLPSCCANTWIGYLPAHAGQGYLFH